MTDMVTRVADAIGTQLLLEGGGYGYAERLTDDEGGQSTDMVVDATVSLTALARAAIEAMRTPTKAMLDAAYENDFQYVDETSRPEEYWPLMIDAALKGEEEKRSAE